MHTASTFIFECSISCSTKVSSVPNDKQIVFNWKYKIPRNKKMTKYIIFFRGLRKFVNDLVFQYKRALVNRWNKNKNFFKVLRSSLLDGLKIYNSPLGCWTINSDPLSCWTITQISLKKGGGQAWVQKEVSCTKGKMCPYIK